MDAGGGAPLRLTPADLARAYATDAYRPRFSASGTSSASRRGAASSTVQYSRGRSPPGRAHVAGNLPCLCPQCLAAAGHLRQATKRRDLQWQTPSPYLEDLTKSLIISQPARRKLQLVPPRRYQVAISPYETMRGTRGVAPRLQTHQLQVQPLRTQRARAPCHTENGWPCQHAHSWRLPIVLSSLLVLHVLQADIAERHLRQLWNQEAAAAAERCGVDLGTYTTLLELQHRDITPEDYDVLQQLDSSTKPKTLNQALLDAQVMARLAARPPPPPPPPASMCPHIVPWHMA